MIAEVKRRVAYINEMIESGHAPQLVAEGENYHAEQFVRKIKHECLSHCLFLSGKALRTVIDAYVEYYNTQRPNTKFNGGCIQEDHTHWQCEGEIRQTAKIPGLITYSYREKPEA